MFEMWFDTIKVEVKLDADEQTKERLKPFVLKFLDEVSSELGQVPSASNYR